MFGKFKRKAENSSLQQLHEQSASKRRFHNFSTAKSVGLLYPYFLMNQTDLKEFIAFLKKQHIRVKTLAYVPESKAPASFIPSENDFLLTKAQVNWFRRPTSADVTAFIEEPFDILIDFSRDKSFPLRYIASLSQAAMRIGRLAYTDNPYEFILAMPVEDGNKAYIEQLKHYLQHISFN